MTRTFRPFRPFRPIARALLAAGALCAAAAASAGPLVFHYTAVGTDGSAITGTFGWSDTAVATNVSADGTSALYYDSAATPTGGFLTGQVSGGYFDGWSYSETHTSWGVMDGTAGGIPDFDVLYVVNGASFIRLEDLSGTALPSGVAALPATLDLAAWGSDHWGRFSWNYKEQLDFTLTSISLASATEPASVPEPGSLALAGLAATAGAVVRRKRRAAGQSAGAVSPTPEAGT